MPNTHDSCSYIHDALGRLKLEKHRRLVGVLDGSGATWGAAPKGRKAALSQTRQDSSTVELIYDLAGRMTDREYSDNTTDEFGYDGASRLTSAIKGRHAITVNRSYADDGQMESESYVLDGRTYTLERTYYADNRVETQTFADGKVMEWIYDARRLVTEVHYDGDLVLGQDHDDGHRLTRQTFANGLIRDIAFTRQDNLRSSDTVRDGATPIDELAFTYAYFPDKNVKKETQAAGTFEDLSFTATYDAGNRVASYNRQDNYPGARETQTWDYDGAGNWDSTTIDGSTQSRDHSDSDQLEQIGTANLSYDPRGNLLADERGNDYTWDLDNRITKAEGSGYSDIEYRYDALGRRIVREQGSQKEVLLWWGNTEQSEHKHQALQTTIQNDLQANPSEQALNTVFARALEGDKQDIQYFHKNYLDHVMAVSDDSGDLLEHYRYTAFGEPEIYDTSGDKLTATDIDNDILWNVRRYEPATGLYMYKYRDYDAVAGRWPSRDPIEEEGGVNLYGFVNNCATATIDYLGKDALGDQIWHVYFERLKESLKPNHMGFEINHFVFAEGGVLNKLNTRARELQYGNHVDKLVRDGVLKKGEWKSIFIAQRPQDNPQNYWSMGVPIIRGQEGAMGHAVDWSLVFRGINVYDTRFWLGSPHHIRVSGSNDYCWDGERNYARNTATFIVWNDRIDSNPNQNDWNNGEWIKYILENWSKNYESVTDIDFAISVRYEDNNKKTRILP